MAVRLVIGPRPPCSSVRPIPPGSTAPRSVRELRCRSMGRSVNRRAAGELPMSRKNHLSAFRQAGCRSTTAPDAPSRVVLDTVLNLGKASTREASSTRSRTESLHVAITGPPRLGPWATSSATPRRNTQHSIRASPGLRPCGRTNWRRSGRWWRPALRPAVCWTPKSNVLDGAEGTGCRTRRPADLE